MKDEFKASGHGITGELSRHLPEETDRIYGYQDICSLNRDLDQEPSEISSRALPIH